MINCPSCNKRFDYDKLGACPHCGTVIPKGSELGQTVRPTEHNCHGDGGFMYTLIKEKGITKW